MRRFPVAVVPRLGERVALSAEASHHLVEVVRIGRGEVVEVFDGAGRVASARLAEVGEDGLAWLEAIDEGRMARPSFPLHLLVGLPKGPAMDDAIRDATEAGATDVHPVRLARSVATGERADRWERIAQSAAQQCGRGDVPAVHPIRSLAEAIDALPGGEDRRIALPGAPRLPAATGPAAVLVGPEGGFTPAEIRLATGRGFVPMGLGAWVLRTPTAAAVAVAFTAPA